MILCCKQDESKFSNCTEFYDFLLNSDAVASAEAGVEVESSRQTLRCFLPASIESMATMNECRRNFCIVFKNSNVKPM